MLPNQWDIFSLFLVHDACLRSYFKNSCFVFHRGFQTLENNKSTWPTASCFHQFSRVWKPQWNTHTRFWYITFPRIRQHNFIQFMTRNVLLIFLSKIFARRYNLLQFCNMREWVWLSFCDITGNLCALISLFIFMA